MNNFDEIMNQLHNNAAIKDAQAQTPIVVTLRRTFEVPPDYDLVLGYAGDVNSQIVTFKLPRFHETHDLSLCTYKKIKWQNLKSGTEGISNLSTDSTDSETWTATWEVPPEIMTIAGQIEIAISIYDEKDGYIAFSWNTPSYKGFSVGESANQIADIKQDNNLPARNEILLVNTETRNIEAPAGWNPLICSYGDIGLSKIFLEINQYIRGLDLMDDKVEVYVGVTFDTDGVEDFKIEHENIRPIFLSESNKKANKVMITWDIPDVITSNEFGYVGSFSISLKIQIKEGDKIVKRWGTTQFNGLAIGPSGILNDVVGLVARDEQIVEKVIDNYFNSNYFIIDNN